MADGEREPERSIRRRVERLSAGSGADAPERRALSLEILWKHSNDSVLVHIPVLPMDVSVNLSTDPIIFGPVHHVMTFGFHFGAAESTSVLMLLYSLTLS